jgi:FlaA1/EpsC-like NDP-sugar epimerase
LNVPGVFEQRLFIFNVERGYSAMKKSLSHLIFLTVIFVITIGVVLLTKVPYANAFLNEAEAIVIIFCAFLAIDVLRWIIRMTIEGAVTQSKRQEISWTIGAVACMAYFCGVRGISIPFGRFT